MKYIHLVNTYREADALQRLDLYMHYREMREAFEEIEKNELQADDHSGEVLVHGKLSPSSAARALRWCYSLFT